jgi:hypothetical protein
MSAFWAGLLIDDRHSIQLSELLSQSPGPEHSAGNSIVVLIPLPYISYGTIRHNTVR